MLVRLARDEVVVLGYGVNWMGYAMEPGRDESIYGLNDCFARNCVEGL